MTEAQRFLRYVTPGLTFGVIVLILLLILIPHWTVSQLTGLLKKDAGLLAVLGTLLASGGAGFLFSILHHAWHWRSGGSDIDHSDKISRLVKAKRLEFVNIENQEEITDAPMIDRHFAWIILTAIWHERLTEDDKQIKGADPRATSLTDLAHSAGTGRVASIAAYATVLTLAYYVSDFSLTTADTCRFIVANLAAILLIFVQHKNYMRLCKMAQGFSERVFCDSLGKQPAQIHIAKKVVN